MKSVTAAHNAARSIQALLRGRKGRQDFDERARLVEEEKRADTVALDLTRTASRLCNSSEQSAAEDAATMDGALAAVGQAEQLAKKAAEQRKKDREAERQHDEEEERRRETLREQRRLLDAQEAQEESSDSSTEEDQSEADDRALFPEIPATPNIVIPTAPNSATVISEAAGAAKEAASLNSMAPQEQAEILAQMTSEKQVTLLAAMSEEQSLLSPTLPAPPQVVEKDLDELVWLEESSGTINSPLFGDIQSVFEAIAAIDSEDGEDNLMSKSELIRAHGGGATNPKFPHLNRTKLIFLIRL